MNASWVVVRVHPGAISGNYETDASERELPSVLRHLQRQNFEYYNPRYLHLRRKVRVPLFGNYLFVVANDNWPRLISTRGIAMVLWPSGEAGAKRLKSNINGLRQCEVGGLIQISQRKFHVGQNVQIRNGPFAFLCGSIEEMRDHDRVTVLMSWLGTVTVGEENLVAA